MDDVQNHKNGSMEHRQAVDGSWLGIVVANLES